VECQEEVIINGRRKPVACSELGVKQHFSAARRGSRIGSASLFSTPGAGTRCGGEACARRSLPGWVCKVRRGRARWWWCVEKVGVSEYRVHVRGEWTGDWTKSITALSVCGYAAKPAQFHLGKYCL
jgi:hypothetical protein